MKILPVTVLPAVLALAGCASPPLVPLPRPAPDTVGEVVVYRESAFAAGGVGLKVGTRGNAFVVLANAEKVRVRLPAGEHEIFVQARSAEPSRVRVNVKAGTTACLRTSSSPDTYAKTVIPIVLMATGYHFYLDEVPCPLQAELEKYKDVPVSYE